MPRGLIVLALCLSLVVTGCNGISGQSSTPSITSQETTGPSESGFPPGLGKDGITNQTQLLIGHQAALVASDYRVAYNLTTARGGAVVSTNTVVRSNQSQQRQRSTSDLPRRSIDQYSTSERRYVRRNISGEVGYETTAVSDQFSAIHQQGARPGELLRTTVQSGNYTLVTRERQAGETVFTYNATNLSANASRQLPDTVQRVRAQVRVTETGLIRRATLLAAGTTDGGQHIVYQEYQVQETEGVNVAEPDWLQEVS